MSNMIKFKMRMMSISGVVAVGRTNDGIVIYVRKGFRINEKLPSNVIVKEVGSFRTMSMPTMSRVRPVFPGVSIAHYRGTAGTLGGVAAYNDIIVGVSANHVVALVWGKMRIGKRNDPILQPGPYDGGRYPHDMVGMLYKWSDVSVNKINITDAAIFIPTQPIQSYIPDIGDIAGTSYPSPGIRVVKFGRTTLKTSSYIEAVDVMAKVSNWGTVTFDNQFIVKQPFADDGDSGSFVIDSAGRVIGMIIAGNDDYILATPIKYIEKDLGIKIVGVGIYE